MADLRRIVGEATRTVCDVARQLLRGASGLHEYEQYALHCRRHHPERPVLTREEFYRRALVERWDGVRRCC